MLKVFTFTLFATACACAAANTNNLGTANAMIELSDGSTLNCTCMTAKLEGSTLFSSQLTLAVEQIKTLAITGANGESKVELSNGDIFSISIRTPHLDVKSTLGNLTISLKNIRKINFSGKSLVIGEPGLTFYCSFDNEFAVKHPAGCAIGKYSTLDLVPGKIGKALRIPAGSTGTTFEIPGSAIGDEGRIELWFKLPEPELAGAYNCGSPRFFAIDDPTNRHFISLDWNCNNGSGGSGITFWGAGSPLATSRSFSGCGIFRELLNNTGTEWHHLILSWTQTSVLLLIDDQYLLRKSNLESGWMKKNLVANKLNLTIPVNEKSGSYMKAPIVIDEFKIWNSPASQH